MIEKITFEMVLSFPYDERSVFQSEHGMSEDGDVQKKIYDILKLEDIYIYGY